MVALVFTDDAPTSNTYIANNCTGNVGGGSTPTGLCTPQGQIVIADDDE